MSQDGQTQRRGATFEKSARVAKPRKQQRSQHKAARRTGSEDRVTLNRTKTRLRSVRRLLENKHDDMPASQRVALEREHGSLQHELQQRLEQSQRKKLISKYHMVRFFERKKAERLLRRARKDAEGDGNVEEMHRREVDLNYTMYFPLTQAYVSLYTKENSASSEPNRASPVWAEVAQAMEAKTLNELRERPAKTKTHLPSNYATKPRSKSRAAAKATGNDGSAQSSKRPDRSSPKDEEGGASSDDGGGTGFFE